MRKVLFMAFILAAFCVVCYGGCGGGNDSSGNTGGTGSIVSLEWRELSGQWKAVSGSMNYYDSAGEVLDRNRLDDTGSNSSDMELTITKSNNAYDIEFGEGSMWFIESEGVTMDGGHGYQFTGYSYSDFSTVYTEQDGSLVASVYLGYSNVRHTAKISCTDNTNLKMIIENEDSVNYTGAVKEVAEVNYVRITY